MYVTEDDVILGYCAIELRDVVQLVIVIIMLYYCVWFATDCIELKQLWTFSIAFVRL